jgi:hypothetical protein
MVRYNTLRTVALLVLCVALASPLATAAAPRPQGHSFADRFTMGDAGDLFGWLRGALGSLWNKNGCELDPNGLCVKAGCQVDPFGRCLNTLTTPTSTNKAGCELDPFGRCRR